MGPKEFSIKALGQFPLPYPRELIPAALNFPIYRTRCPIII